MRNLLKRDFVADKPYEKLGTDITEFRVAEGKAYLAPVYDMASKEIIAWDVPTHPDLAPQQQRLLAMFEQRLPKDAHPILHSDMGWQYQHRWWQQRMNALGIRQSMSRGATPGQRRHQTGIRPSQRRVLHRTQIHLVRRVQTGTRPLHRAPEH